jgi:glycosyltransferase involved in cell wall biosynthesis
LTRLGWDINFITHTPPADLSGWPTEFPVYSVGFNYLGGCKAQMPLALLGLWRAMQQADADYYVLKVPGHLLALMALFCRIYRRCLVSWGQTTYRTKDQRRHIPWSARCMEYVGLRAADILIAQSHDQAQMLKAETCRTVHVIKNIAEQLEVPGVKNATRDVSLSKCDVLWAGNATSNKRPGVVLELARLMPQVSFAMAMNKSSDMLFEHWRLAAQQLPNFHFLGEVPPVEMEGLFHRTRLLLNTSQREGFPNTFLQAWMNNVPVVSLEIDPDQLIRKQGFGRMASAAAVEQAGENAVQLAECLVPVIRELLQKVEICKKIGSQAARYINEQHTPDVTIPCLIRVLTWHANKLKGMRCSPDKPV